jgi:glucosamine-6-phosphate deaminase
LDIYADRSLIEDSPIPLEIVETDIDLYYRMAYSLYRLIDANNQAERETVVIMPVGPVFQYRRFIYFLKEQPIDLSRLHCFFMDEYLTDSGERISAEDSLSFRGFITRELTDPMPTEMGFRNDQVYFPDPADPSEYDRRLAELGGAQVCYAGVGINGHLAFNEADGAVSAEEFRRLPTRVLALTRETITINSNTALGGAFEVVPKRAITVGFRQIYESKAIRIYMNRPWQRAVVRKMLFGPETTEFPASLVRAHPDVAVTVTAEVATPPAFALK